MSGASSSSGSGESATHVLNNTTFLEKQRQLKLPIAEVPKFDGDHNKWLSYKNMFLSMVDARSDIDDLNKFLYLKIRYKGRLQTRSRFSTSAHPIIKSRGNFCLIRTGNGAFS